MNPIKVFKDSLPMLNAVLESIHGHLEKILEVEEKNVVIQKEILMELKELNAKNKIEQ